MSDEISVEVHNVVVCHWLVAGRIRRPLLSAKSRTHMDSKKSAAVLIPFGPRTALDGLAARADSYRSDLAPGQDHRLPRRNPQSHARRNSRAANARPAARF